MADFVVILLVAAAVAAAVWYIRKEKKKGVKCIGCPDSGTCGKTSCGGGTGFGCSCQNGKK